MVCGSMMVGGGGCQNAVSNNSFLPIHCTFTAAADCQMFLFFFRYIQSLHSIPPPRKKIHFPICPLKIDWHLHKCLPMFTETKINQWNWSALRHNNVIIVLASVKHWSPLANFGPIPDILVSFWQMVLNDYSIGIIFIQKASIPMSTAMFIQNSID